MTKGSNVLYVTLGEGLECKVKLSRPYHGRPLLGEFKTVFEAEQWCACICGVNNYIVVYMEAEDEG